MNRYDDSEGSPNRDGVSMFLLRAYPSTSKCAFTDRYHEKKKVIHLFLTYKPVLNLAVLSFTFFVQNEAK